MHSLFGNKVALKKVLLQPSQRNLRFGKKNSKFFLGVRGVCVNQTYKCGNAVHLFYLHSPDVNGKDCNKQNHLQKEV